MKKITIPTLGAGFLLLSLSACLPLNEDQCRTANWQRMGMDDGVAGRDARHFDNYVEDCAEHGIRPDQASWLEGYERGLTRYCTPRSAYLTGKRGLWVNNVCPDMEVLERPNAVGRAYHAIDEEIDDLRDKRDDIREDMERLSRMEETRETKRLMQRYWRLLNRLERHIDELLDARAELPVYR